MIRRYTLEELRDMEFTGTGKIELCRTVGLLAGWTECQCGAPLCFWKDKPHGGGVLQMPRFHEDLKAIIKLVHQIPEGPTRGIYQSKLNLVCEGDDWQAINASAFARCVAYVLTHQAA